MQRQKVAPPATSFPCKWCKRDVRWGHDFLRDRRVLLEADAHVDGEWVRDGSPAEVGGPIPIRRFRPDLPNLADAPKFMPHRCVEGYEAKKKWTERQEARRGR